MKSPAVGVVVGLLALLAVPLRDAVGQTAAPGAEEVVVGLSVRNAHRAYPTRLFSDRRVVNDVIGDLEVAVFHDPERGVSSAWFRLVHGEPIEFSSTGTGTVVEDLTTITRWDLTTGLAVGGNLQGQQLVPLPVLTTSWAGWTERHPNAQVFRDAR